MVVVGGLTSVWGAIFGAIALRYAEYVVSGGLQLIVTGAGVLFLLLVFPGGLGEVGLRIRQFGLDRIARRRGITDGGPPRRRRRLRTGAGAREPGPITCVAWRRANEIHDRAKGTEVHSDLDAGRGLSLRPGSGCRLRIAAGPLRRRFRRPPGRGRGAARHQRRREVDPRAGPVGPHPTPAGGRSPSTGTTSPGASPEHLARLGVAHAPGGRGVYPGLTVGENLRLAMWTFRSDKQRCEEATERVFELFPILRQRAAQPAGLLSGGQQQMLALAQALAPDPRLLIIDELSLGLAPAVVEELLDVVSHLKGGGLTTILVEQSVTVALHVASRAVFLEKGTVRFSGAATELAARDDLLRSVFLEGGGRQIRPASASPPGRRHARARCWPAPISRSASGVSPRSTAPG